MNIKTELLHRLRAQKALLILCLGEEAQLSLWRQGESQWQEAQAGGELEAWLRDVLLAHDVEEGINLLVLLADALLQTEQLTLPRLPAKQLRKTLAWEAAQLFNLPQGSYSFCSKILAESANAEQVVQLWALEHVRQAEYVALAQRLLVKLAGLCVGWREQFSLNGDLEADAAKTDVSLSVEAVAQAWFAGEPLLLLPAPSRRIDWQQCYEGCEQYLPRLAWGTLLCACVMLAASFALRYFAQQDLHLVQQEAERYAVWQQRKQESEALEKQVARLKQQAERRKAQMLVSKELEAWGRLGLRDVYLTALEYKLHEKKGKQESLLLAQGRAKDGVALESLIEGLKKSGRYSGVKLLESQQQGESLSFRLQADGR